MHLMLILLKQSTYSANDKMKGKIVDVGKRIQMGTKLFVFLK
jgi:hypothetical protein